MEIKEYFSIIRKRFWLIILLPAIAATASYFFSNYLLEPTYEANLTLYINSNFGDQITVNTDEMIARQYLVKDYRELIKSRTVVSAVIEELGLSSTTPEKLAGSISVNSRNDTRIIEIKVRNTDPQKATDIANKTGDVFVKKIAQLIKLENISIVDYAIKPSEPVSPDIPVNIAAAVGAGLITAFGLVFLAEYLDNTIKSEEDVERFLKLNVLGVVPKSK